MNETKAMFFSVLMAAALGLMMAEALADQLPDPVGPVAVAYGD
jgi:hypothetical protein